jgi:hypothetical protein
MRCTETNSVNNNVKYIYEHKYAATQTANKLARLNRNKPNPMLMKTNLTKSKNKLSGINSIIFFAY